MKFDYTDGWIMWDFTLSKVPLKFFHILKSEYQVGETCDNCSIGIFQLNWYNEEIQCDHCLKISDWYIYKPTWTWKNEKRKIG